MLTQENMFDASLLRSFLLDFHEDESDLEDFFSDVEMDESFLRGFMAGLVQSIMIERAHGEVIGRLSQAMPSSLNCMMPPVLFSWSHPFSLYPC
jgi:hypothetical protein